MMPISERVESYLAWRETLGTGLSASAVQALRTFAAFAAGEGAQQVTAELFLLWKERYGSAGRKSWSYRLSHVRAFAAWLQALDPDTEVPPKDLVPADRGRPQPYIYSDRQIADLVEAAARLHSPTGRGLRGPTYATLFGLLAVTGLRVGEALRLDDDDFDARAATLQVRHAKNHARRVVPLAPCTAERLEAYRSVRDRSVVRQAPGLFLGEHGRPVSIYMAEYTFARCSEMTGLRERRADYRCGTGPRLHDVRHSYAVKTLIDWHRSGLDVDRELYKLSAWLGHRSPGSTYWYLEAVPELLRMAVQKAERACVQGRPS